MISWMSLKMGHVGSKTRSSIQMIENCPILLNLGQNNILLEIWVRFESLSCGVKNRPLGQVIKNPCGHSKSHIYSQILMNLGWKSRLDLNLRHVGSKLGYQVK
jgi:hypothetical protein